MARQAQRTAVPIVVLISFILGLEGLAMAADTPAPKASSMVSDRSWGEAQLGLRQTVSDWIHAALARQKPIPFQGGHDELNYMASWPRFWLLTGDETVISFLREMRNQLMAWPGLQHGFYAKIGWMDIEHSVENWTEFVTALARADPTDATTLRCLEDVAHHLGNWEPGVPEWFDWKRGCFRSEYIATTEVRDHPPDDYCTYWDARAVELGLTVYDLTGQKRYLDLAHAFASAWADEMQRGPDLGCTVLLPVTDREQIKKLYGDYPEKLHQFEKGWLWEITSHLLHVYTLTKDEKLARAALKVIELTPGFHNPRYYAAYEQATGDKRFAEQLKSDSEARPPDLEALLAVPLPTILLLEGTGPYPERKYAFRTEAGELRDYKGPGSQSLLRAAAQADDGRLAARAYDLAARELALAAGTLRDGREHGCNGRFIHGAGGEAVAVLCSGAGLGTITYRHDGKPGLAAKVAATLLNQKDGRAVYLYNGADKPIGARLTPGPGPGKWAVETFTKAASGEVALAAHSVARLPLKPPPTPGG